MWKSEAGSSRVGEESENGVQSIPSYSTKRPTVTGGVVARIDGSGSELEIAEGLRLHGGRKLRRLGLLGGLPLLFPRPSGPSGGSFFGHSRVWVLQDTREMPTGGAGVGKR